MESKDIIIKGTLMGYCEGCKRNVKLYTKHDKGTVCGKCWAQKRLNWFGFSRVKVVVHNENW